MIPGELVALQEKFYEDDIIFLTAKAEHVAEYFSIDFTIMLQSDKESGSQDWNVQVDGFQKCNIHFEPAYEIKIEEEYPLLWSFTQQQTELHYSGKVTDPYKLIHRLYQTHASLFKTTVPFSLLKNEEQQFAFTNGLLANGPKKLMEKYSEVLVQQGLDFTISLADDWDSYPLLGNGQLQVLVFGGSFVVGERFRFRRVG